MYNHKEYMKAYNKKNREKNIISSREYHKNNREEALNKQKEYNAKRRFVKLPKKWEISYFGAKQRCNNPNNKAYRTYGGRGIKFILLTKSMVEVLFSRDNGDKMEKPSIDRVDNDGNYTYENCRFIEQRENASKGNKLTKE